MYLRDFLQLIFTTVIWRDITRTRISFSRVIKQLLYYNKDPKKNLR